MDDCARFLCSSLADHSNSLMLTVSESHSVSDVSLSENETESHWRRQRHTDIPEAELNLRLSRC